jgi:hypothetical protein
MDWEQHSDCWKEADFEEDYFSQQAIFW